jgi:hypothetical protein
VETWSVAETGLSNLDSCDAMFMEPKSALIAAPLKTHLERPHAQPFWCLSMNVHSFPGDI